MDTFKTNLDNLKLVCNLSIPTIVSALHQKAVQKVAEKFKDVRISNSAIEADGKTEKITSAGEHIVSAVAKKDGDEIKKPDALAALQLYVSWFVGPDLAKMITEDKLFDLGGNSAKNESFSTKTFLEFLLEASENEESAEEENDEESAEEENDEESAEEENDEESADNKSSDSKKPGNKEKGNADAPIGYYIAYNLKVEGMKSTTLKDAMKSFSLHLFDGIKITPSGLFGGGAAFTLGDVRKSIRDLFGLDGVNPNELKAKIRDNLNRKFPDLKDVNDIDVRDKNTLLKRLKGKLNGKAIEKINSADYSIWIRVNDADDEKPFLNKAVVADLVTSSIKGIVSKFKNKVSKDDVILLKHFVDTKTEGQKINQLVDKVLSYQDFIDVLGIKQETVTTKDKKTDEKTTKTVSSVADPMKSLKQLTQYIENEIQKKNKKYYEKSDFAQTTCNKLLSMINACKKDNPTVTSDNVIKLANDIKTYLQNQRQSYNSQQQQDESVQMFQMLDSRLVVESILEMMFEDYRPSITNNSTMNKKSDDLTHSSIMQILFNEADDAESAEEEPEKTETSIGATTEGSVPKENTPSNDDSKEHGEDLYIIPMPGLRFPPDESHDSAWNNTQSS